jgi:hypothetical protein
MVSMATTTTSTILLRDLAPVTSAAVKRLAVLTFDPIVLNLSNSTEGALVCPPRVSLSLHPTLPATSIQSFSTSQPPCRVSTLTFNTELLESNKIY